MKVENGKSPPAIDRETLGRVCREAMFPPEQFGYFDDISDVKFKERYCVAAETLRDYVLANQAPPERPEEVELDRDWCGETAYLVLWPHSEWMYELCKKTYMERGVEFARAVLSRYAPAPSAPPSPATNYSEISAAAAGMAMVLYDVVASPLTPTMLHNIRMALDAYAKAKVKPATSAPQEPAAVVDEDFRHLLEYAFKVLGDTTGSHDAECECECCHCYAQLKFSPYRLSAIPSAGSEGTDWKARYDELFGWYQTACRYLDERNKELLATPDAIAERDDAWKRRNELLEENVNLTAERDQKDAECDRMAKCMAEYRDEYAKAAAERDQLRAENERLEKYAKGIELAVQRGIKLESIGPVGMPAQGPWWMGTEKKATPTPPADRTVREGMRARANIDCMAFGEYKLRKGDDCILRRSDDPKLLPHWKVIDSRGRDVSSFDGDTLPSYLDPITEPVEAKGDEVHNCLRCGGRDPVDQKICDQCWNDPLGTMQFLSEKQAATPAPSEPDIVLPEAVTDDKGNTKITFIDGFFLKRLKHDNRWFAWNASGYQPEGINNPFESPEEAARALRDIGQGPGAKVETASFSERLAADPELAKRCEAVEEELRESARPEIEAIESGERNAFDFRPPQPSPPPFDVERWISAIAKGMTAFSPYCRVSDHEKGEKAARAAMKAALGGKE